MCFGVFSLFVIIERDTTRFRVPVSVDNFKSNARRASLCRFVCNVTRLLLASCYYWLLLLLLQKIVSNCFFFFFVFFVSSSRITGYDDLVESEKRREEKKVNWKK